LLVAKLNELVAGETIENADVKTLTHTFARDPMNASLFNHASMAHNNHLFFQTLSTAPAQLENLPALRDSLIKAFGSIETLKMTMIDTAAGMFGPGFVWLVYAQAPGGGGRMGARAGSWKILTTYLAGTPYPEAGYRQQGIDMNSATPDAFGKYMQEQHLQPTNSAGAFGPYSQTGREQAKLPPGGTSLMPVLCVNTWQYAWLYEYGVTGKRSYLEKWWSVVDWGVVDQNTPSPAKAPLFQGSGGM
jgi:Fe-Mn family superoxide dismutase